MVIFINSAKNSEELRAKFTFLSTGKQIVMAACRIKHIWAPHSDDIKKLVSNRFKVTLSDSTQV